MTYEKIIQILSHIRDDQNYCLSSEEKEAITLAIKVLNISDKFCIIN